MFLLKGLLWLVSCLVFLILLIMGESLEGGLLIRRNFVFENIAGKDLDVNLECYISLFSWSRLYESGRWFDYRNVNSLCSHHHYVNSVH